MPKQSNIYLNNTSLPQALSTYLSKLPAPATTTIPVVDALGLTTSQAIFAVANSPLYDCAAMDGIAVIAAHTTGAREVEPKTLAETTDYITVDTGDPVPLPYNAVIMVEDIQKNSNGSKHTATIYKAAAPYQHIRPVGEDVVKGELILPANHKIRPVDIGSLLSAGLVEIEVYKKPTVAIIPTGTELIEPGDTAVTGSIIESNSRMLAALVTEDGGTAIRYPIVPDVYENLRDTLVEATQTADIVLLCSGTSAGRDDYTKSLLEELGQVHIHGIAIKPGKPAVLATIGPKAVIGVPGYPVSAYVVYANIIRPVLLGGRMPQPTTIQARLTKRLVSSLKYREFVRMKVGKVQDQFIATPLPRGAGASMSLVRADGFLAIDQDMEGIEAGATVPITLLKEESQLSNTLVSIGSHDIIMDIIAQSLSLSSSHVGTMGGLMALKNFECHIAPIHHLCEDSGEYNLPILRQLFATGNPVALIKGVKRIQGIIVQKGNPQNIQSIGDLVGQPYINRSRGTGTRMFFDYKLKGLGIDPSTIPGYQREAATHMNVASIVKSGGAVAGLGVESAAKSLDLDFIPIGVEDYDFALYQADLTHPQVEAFIAVLKSPAFAQALEKIGGYMPSNTQGDVILC